jgi:hypothetical protein
LTKAEAMFAQEMYVEYKANPIPLEAIKLPFLIFKHFLKTMHIPIIRQKVVKPVILIGTVQTSGKTESTSFHGNSDKDFAQLVSENTFLCGSSEWVTGIRVVPEVLEKFEVIVLGKSSNFSTGNGVECHG